MVGGWGDKVWDPKCHSTSLTQIALSSSGHSQPVTQAAALQSRQKKKKRRTDRINEKKSIYYFSIFAPASKWTAFPLQAEHTHQSEGLTQWPLSQCLHEWAKWMKKKKRKKSELHRAASISSFWKGNKTEKCSRGMPALLHRVACQPQLLRRGSSGDEISPLCSSLLLRQEGSCKQREQVWGSDICVAAGFHLRENNSTSVAPDNAKYLQMDTVWDKQQGKRCYLIYKFHLHCWSSLERKQHVEHQLLS